MSRAMRFLVPCLALALAIGVGGGCGKSGQQGGQKGSLLAGGDGKSVTLDGKALEIAGVTVTPPAAWKDLGPSGMRATTYVFGPVAGDADSATVAVFFFGQSQGGDVNSNIERWVNQMSLPDGGDPGQAATRDDAVIDGMPAHHVQLEGTYNAAAMGGGMMMGGQPVAKERYLMSGIVLEAPQGNLFFKLTGPQKTATAMNEAFLAMLRAARKSG